MKKTLMLAAVTALCITESAKAQYTPEKNSVSLEVQFNPFDQKGKTFSLDGLKVRYFLSEQSALQLKLGINGAQSKLEYTPINFDSKDITLQYKTTELKIDLGYEHHFPLAKRLDLYVGGLIGIGKRFASFKKEETPIDRPLTNYSVGSGEIKITELGLQDDSPSPDLLESRPYLGFNFAAITGIDFYVYKGLYIGTELGFNVETRKIDKIETESEENVQDLKNKGRVTSYGFHIEPVLRLGWTF